MQGTGPDRPGSATAYRKVLPLGKAGKQCRVVQIFATHTHTRTHAHAHVHREREREIEATYGSPTARGQGATPVPNPGERKRDREAKQKYPTSELKHTFPNTPESPITGGGPIGRGALLAPYTLGKKER